MVCFDHIKGANNSDHYCMYFTIQTSQYIYLFIYWRNKESWKLFLTILNISQDVYKKVLWVNTS